MSGPAKLTQIWRMQWARERDLSAWRRLSVPVITNEKFAAIVNDAFEAGYTDGELQGRVNLRRDIENGEVAPIEPVQASADSSTANPAEGPLNQALNPKGTAASE